MKVKALQDFNLGSMAKDYKEGDEVEVTASVGKELIDLGLAKEVKLKPGEDRETKPVTGPTENKDTVITTSGTKPDEKTK